MNGVSKACSANTLKLQHRRLIAQCFNTLLSARDRRTYELLPWILNFDKGRSKLHCTMSSWGRSTHRPDIGSHLNTNLFNNRWCEAKSPPCPPISHSPKDLICVPLQLRFSAAPLPRIALASITLSARNPSCLGLVP